MTRPMAAPPASSAAAERSRCHHGSGAPPGARLADRAVTRSTTGASLKPDSASSMPDTRRGSGTRRSTENTAAASVEASTAPTRSDTSHDQPSTTCAATATTATLTATPTVDSTAAGATAPRISGQCVVTPPSTRISTRAAYPSTCVSCSESYWMPRPDSPRASPMAR